MHSISSYFYYPCTKLRCRHFREYLLNCYRISRIIIFLLASSIFWQMNERTESMSIKYFSNISLMNQILNISMHSANINTHASTHTYRYIHIIFNWPRKCSTCWLAHILANAQWFRILSANVQRIPIEALHVTTLQLSGHQATKQEK